MEFDLVVRRACAAGFYVNRHRNYDPCVETGGDLYLMERRKFAGEKCETLLRYTTPDQIYKWLNAAGA